MQSRSQSTNQWLAYALRQRHLHLQGYTYAWSASPANAFTVSSGTGPTFQTANIGNTSGTITLTVNTPCPISFTRQVTIGAPQYPTSEESDQADICNGVAHIRITNYDPALTYTIRGYRATAINDRDGTFRLKAGGGTTNASYTITVSNGCGTSTSDQTFVDFTCSNGYRYATYPNPSSDAVTVQQSSATPQSQSAQPSAARSASPAAKTSSAQPTALAEAASFRPFTVRLYDAYGKLWLEQPALASALHLRTASLPAGAYVVHVLMAGVVVQRVPLGIQH